MNRRYRQLEVLGSGAGCFFKAVDCNTDALVVLQKVNLNCIDNGVPSILIRQASLLRSLSHPSIIKLLDVGANERKVWLVFELMEQNLKQYLDHTTTPLPKCQIESFLRQMVDGIVFFNTHRVIHRDLKPQNLLISADGRTIKIADFGLARAFDLPLRTLTHEVVTLWYRAPEILLGSVHYTPAVDMWSLGCILYEMATKTPLFPGDSEIDQLYRIFRLLGTPTNEVWPRVSEYPDYNSRFPRWIGTGVPQLDRLGVVGMDLLSQCLILCPCLRISALGATSHPFCI